MVRENYVEKLSLVSLNMTDRLFEILLNILKGSQFLKSIDLSWCEVKLSNYVKLFEFLSTNIELHSVTLQWNLILD